mmetsp:Transcript_45055/g.109561  ORF Transcript_45055/g.109561 Transcript_45055/m.109561 type:complete len:86 (+) Transcript_45055:443-700(+)
MMKTEHHENVLYHWQHDTGSNRSSDNDIIRDRDDAKNDVVNGVRNVDDNVKSKDLMNDRNIDGGGTESYDCYRSLSRSKHCVVRY